MDFKSIDIMREYFAGDEFATKCLGARIDSFEPGRAVVSMDLDDRHHNAQGFVMGGVPFSLADFALAVCSNVDQPPSASVVNTIEYLRRAKGQRLIATCVADKAGRTLGFYTIDVHDELGTHVAKMTATVMRTG